MGLKTNKATKTTRLNCQYVGSFAVRDGDKNLPVSEQSKFVDEKLKKCTKKLLDGSPVCLQVSPDGIQVLTSDEKTVKMAHTLRRVSYATAETTNKLFAYVTHQPGSDMEIVCHTFVTKRKDYAEGLSAALGKLFKQSFAYTLKRRDKLEEAAQKRGGNRRWAKHQVAAGHGAIARQPRNENTRSANTSEAKKENVATSRTAVQQRPNQSASPVAKSENEEPRRRSPPTILNKSPSSELDDPFSPPTPAVRQTAANQSASPVAKSEPERPRRRSPPGIPNRSSSSELDDPFLPPTPAVRQTATVPHTATVHSPPTVFPNPNDHPTLNVHQTHNVHQTPNVYPTPSEQIQQVGSLPYPTQRETSFTPSDPPCSIQQSSSFEDASFASFDDQAPPLPSRSQPRTLPSRSQPSRSPLSSPWSSQEADAPPELPSRSLPRRSSAPNSPESVYPPSSLKHYISDSSVGFQTSGHSQVPPNVNRGERKFNAPPNLMPSSPSHPPSNVFRRSSSSGSSGEDFPTHQPKNMGDGATVPSPWLGNLPPPLPRKSKPQAPPEIPEEVITPEEDERLRQGVPREARISLTLEDEDWYIPGVSRDSITEMLEYSDVGSFFVRDSQSCPGCYALTMKVITSKNNPTGFGHYLITPDGGGFSLQGFDKSFPDISTLIRHYSSCDDGLPCQLILAGSNPLFHDANGYLVEFMDDEEDIYGNLSDCSSMFRELNMNDPW